MTAQVIRSSLIEYRIQDVDDDEVYLQQHLASHPRLSRELSSKRSDQQQQQYENLEAEEADEISYYDSLLVDAGSSSSSETDSFLFQPEEEVWLFGGINDLIMN